MPRRIPDYPDVYAGWNYVSSIGSYISAISAIIFLLMIYVTLRSGKKCPDKQWEGGTTLEWTLSSPPPFHSFEKLPVIK
jgi:heme/copper-type cytochrome/quinol oxidase subunit 1